MLRAGLASMSDFDAFAARLLLLGLLLGRRVVMPQKENAGARKRKRLAH